MRRTPCLGANDFNELLGGGMKQNAQKPASAESQKAGTNNSNKQKAYVPPQLVCLGSFLDLTAAGSLGGGFE